MKPDELNAELERIRVAAVLAHFPVHHLTTSAGEPIVIRETDADGQVTLRWEVTHNAKFGPPGPLAYQVDTLAVNRRLDEAPRPFPRLIRLGSLRETARMAGTSDGHTSEVRHALMQNAGAMITAKVSFRGRNGAKRWIELASTRYGVFFTGQMLPDGRKADAVYIELHGTFRELLDQAQTRPLDYNLLRALPIVAQRLYELLSHAMYAALKQGQGPARLNYGEFCLLAPQTRYATLWEARRQMDRLHKPLIKAGYIAGQVGYEVTHDREGRPDWIMLYTPGPRAWDEFKTFTRRPAAPAQRALPSPIGPPSAPPSPLVAELVERGVSPAVAAELVGASPEERIRAQIAALDWHLKHSRKKIAEPGAYLAESIRRDYAPPAGMVRAAQRAEQRAAEEAQASAARVKRDRDRAEQAQVDAYWRGLDAEEQATLDAAALEHADDLAREQMAKGRPKFVEAMRQSLREDEIRRRLDLPAPS